MKATVRSPGCGEAVELKIEGITASVAANGPGALVRKEPTPEELFGVLRPPPG